jgi:hypothetical protein
MALIKMGCHGLPQRLGTTAMWLALVKVAREAILEAVYRYQFDHNASGQQSAAGVYCLSLSLAGEKDEDPPSPVVDVFPEDVRGDLADALARLDAGLMLSMPLSRPMPNMGRGVHELRL